MSLGVTDSNAIQSWISVTSSARFVSKCIPHANHDLSRLHETGLKLSPCSGLKLDKKFEAIGFAIATGDLATAGLKAAFYNGQAETSAAGIPAAGVLGPEKRIEDVGQRVGGKAGALVSQREVDLAAAGLGAQLDGAGLAGVSYSVAQQVTQGAGEQC